jgi:uncharacterized Tic20 family protein
MAWFHEKKEDMMDEQLNHVSATKDERNMALLAHLLTIVASWVAPLIIWLVKKDESKFIELHSVEALNFQITVFIAYIVIGAVTFGIGSLLVWVVSIIFSVIASTKANKGELYRYPISIRIIK